MDVKDKIDGLKYLSQIHRSQFDERRRYEWRIVFTTLSFYVLAVAAVYLQGARLPSDIIVYKLFIWLFMLFIAFSVCSFLKTLHKANAINKTFSEKAENAIANLLIDEDSAVESLFPGDVDDNYSWHNLLKLKIMSLWSWRWQVIIMFSFAIAAAALISFN